MKIYLDCYACFLRQTLEAARHAGADENGQLILLRKMLTLLQSLEPGQTPPEIGHRVHALVRRQTGARDPYLEVKMKSTREALDLMPRLRKLIAASNDRLDTAIRLSIAGNIIDFAVADHVDDLWTTIERVLAAPFAIDDRGAFRKALIEADSVLFLADNAGETVFDRLLIEQLAPPVTYVVKSAPVLNDATREDAIAAGLDRCGTIIDNGSDAPGTILRLCSEPFHRRFDAAPLIIAKGQANYETLSEAGPRVFSMFQVKCPVTAGDAGAPVGSIILRQAAVRE